MEAAGQDDLVDEGGEAGLVELHEGELAAPHGGDDEAVGALSVPGEEGQSEGVGADIHVLLDFLFEEEPFGDDEVAATVVCLVFVVVADEGGLATGTLEAEPGEGVVAANGQEAELALGRGGVHDEERAGEGAEGGGGSGQLVVRQVEGDQRCLLVSEVEVRVDHVEQAIGFVHRGRDGVMQPILERWPPVEFLGATEGREQQRGECDLAQHRAPPRWTNYRE